MTSRGITTYGRVGSQSRVVAACSAAAAPANCRPGVLPPQSLPSAWSTARSAAACFATAAVASSAVVCRRVRLGAYCRCILGVDGRCCLLCHVGGVEPHRRTLFILAVTSKNFREETALDDVDIGPACSNSCCKKSDHGDKSLVNIDDMDWLSMDTSPSSTPYGTPIFSRESSFSSFTSCFSSLGDSLLDSESEEETELQDTGELNPDSQFTDEFMEQTKGSLIQVDESQLRHGAAVDDGASFHVPADENILHGQQGLETHGDITKENLAATNFILDSHVSSEPHEDDTCNDQLTEANYGLSMEDTCPKQSDVIEIEEITSLPMPGGEIIPLNQQVTELDGVKENTIVYNNILSIEPDKKPCPDIDDGNECIYPLAVPSFDSDSLIWLPPEPANKEDDIDVSTNDDESDDNSTEWGFSSDGGTDKGWLDIVASLSWDAALLIKPDANSGDPMDPCLYVKVKCIASGSRQQSEVISGLVFKKSAAHKQMRANIKHPKLLFLQGALGYCSTGLSSMNSMKQESEQLEKTLSDVIEKYHPDVMLVEKAVSRNTNEYIQKQGVTVVSDMNIHRLERIARCTGSQIMQLQDVHTKPNFIKQCESIRFEKFTEEHDITGEDGRRTFKTYFFLEGFPKPLGCTILLKGATSEELKKIKRVLHFTVFAAYHLILETSFFADQKLFTTDRITMGKENCFESDRLLPDKYSDTIKHSIPTCDRQSANMEDLVPHTEKSVSLHIHDSKVKNSRDPAGGELVDRKAIQSYSSLPVSHPSTNSARETSSSDWTEPTTCDGLDQLTSPAISSKKHNCLSCGESPESHMYSYTHHNGTLTVLVKRLPLESSLSCGRHGRIWMWTRCLRCNAKPTQRVVISSSARNLSFGKFLELSFSTHSSAKKLSTCGHSLHRDCLRFFGFGSKVAMFRYSSVEIYSAHKPPLMLEFSNQNRKNWLDVEVNTVHNKWKLLFSEVENVLQDWESRYSNQERSENTNISVYGRLFLEVSRMLAQEKNETEVYLKEPGQIVKVEGFAPSEILGLNWLYQQFFLGLYVWDVRLHHILQYIEVNSASLGNSVHESSEENELNNSESIADRDIPSAKDLGMEREQGTIITSNCFYNSCSGVILNEAQLTDKSIAKEHESPLCPDHDVRLSPASSVEVSVLFPNDEQTAPSIVNELHHAAIPSDDTRKWVWNRFSQVEMEYKTELQCGLLDKFHLINKYTPLYLSSTHHKHQIDLGYCIVGPGGSILSIAEEEISSIIAYALTISEQQGFYSEAAFVKDELVDGRKIDKLASSNMDKDASLLSSILSPSDSLEKNHNFIRNASTVSEESTSGFYDSFLSALKDLHPEICVDNENIPLKSKYTVVCIYAKQFRDLRKICCPSELAYISSISRCKSWNAQGGKSKRMNVMDYSLFVGVDKQKKELVFGIIDYLRQYTWDKQLESWVKTSLVVPKNQTPTVISPREYKLRFRAFISQYFLSVPDA
ncbi:hypothetical protein PR202_gb04046 [Eleusine coracana subsp. coracana]|uniref:1-phosphatidylinositol-3-phosphate 5-kinase n=1 Tax=Eleusine coracana subsp. coracana TaxID=191504 RepID=A0AAV5E137_ELECO|nr:hypothetical protein PR202_gb04046 [Eleusine coracana subsp. coracana]